uniref:Ig-like domain-containing protein n=1 Tax=Cyprinus carpio TaxID=7962 RepID=A0A8C1W1Q2_CYPCA
MVISLLKTWSMCRYCVLPSVLMKSGPVYVSTEGETVKISCPYPDGYINTPKYFCRHPCTSSDHVLIKTVKHDQVVSDGRYSMIDSVDGRSFTVSIKQLRLTDSGVYYCGLDQWFKDTLKKVNLSVHQAPVSRSTHTPENTHITSTWTTTLTSAGTSSQQTNDQFDNNTLITYNLGKYIQSSLYILFI